ncbi:MAG TPA: peptidylprolyl isomerase [Candidatus Dormibacteraeota bacterium]|nr:peptidylprolyl isomerase [Candidatus Dormibacteraeota bacterium]
MRPLVALGISVLVVALVIGAGVGIDWAIGPHPAPAFSKCRTASQLGPDRYTAAPPMCIDTNAAYSGTFKTTKGDVSFNLLTKQTPKTVNNFIVLAENGYFNGRPFFNSQDWVIQSGDPQGNGQGGPGYTLPPEPPAADEQWAPGSMGMARFPDGTISGSQFFILKSAWSGGNPTAVYNHFATITLGMDVVGQLDASDRILSVEIKRA